MTARAWRAPVVKGPRADGSWSLAVERARESWAGLTGQTDGPYSEAAADAILRVALALWADTAAALTGGRAS